jgi:type IV pilus assembly protein PilM
MAGLDTAVVDVDYFALQNAFELARGDLASKTVALVNIGARFSSINICRNGQSLFTGDMSIGGKFLTDAVAQELSIPAAEAEQLKRLDEKSAAQNPAVVEIVERNVEFMASEFNRQLSFFWSASGADDAIDRILVAGGTSQTAGLCDAVTEKTGVHCELFDPLGGVAIGDEFDPPFVRGVAPLLGVCVGLAIRQPGDRITPEGLS